MFNNRFLTTLFEDSGNFNRIINSNSKYSIAGALRSSADHVNLFSETLKALLSTRMDGELQVGDTQWYSFSQNRQEFLDKLLTFEENKIKFFVTDREISSGSKSMLYIYEHLKPEIAPVFNERMVDMTSWPGVDPTRFFVLVNEEMRSLNIVAPRFAEKYDGQEEYRCVGVDTKTAFLNNIATHISVLFPDLFADKPLNEKEQVLLGAIMERDATAPSIAAAFTALFATFDMPRQFEQQLRNIDKFAASGLTKVLEDDVERYRNSAETKLGEYRAVISEYYSKLDQLTGLKQRIESGEETPLYDLLTQSRSIEIRRVLDGGSTIVFDIKTILNQFDEEEFLRCCYNNTSSPLYGSAWARDFPIGDRTMLMREIFSEEHLSIRSCINVSLTLKGRTTGHYNMTRPQNIVDCMPNPHLAQYQCLGTFRSDIEEARGRCDYVAMITTFVAATQNINFSDSIVFRHLVEYIFNTYKDVPFIYDEDGNAMTTKEAIRYCVAHDCRTDYDRRWLPENFIEYTVTPIEELAEAAETVAAPAPATILAIEDDDEDEEEDRIIVEDDDEEEEDRIVVEDDDTPMPENDLLEEVATHIVVNETPFEGLPFDVEATPFNNETTPFDDEPFDDRQGTIPLSRVGMTYLDNDNHLRLTISPTEGTRVTSEANLDITYTDDNNEEQTASFAVGDEIPLVVYQRLTHVEHVPDTQAEDTEQPLVIETIEDTVETTTEETPAEEITEDIPFNTALSFTGNVDEEEDEVNDLLREIWDNAIPTRNFNDFNTDEELMLV